MLLTEREYYTAPTDEIFDDIKQTACKLWLGYDDTHGYATEKIARIKDLTNIKDNYAYIVAMFDSFNKAKLLGMLVLSESKLLVGKILE